MKLLFNAVAIFIFLFTGCNDSKIANTQNSQLDSNSTINKSNINSTKDTTKSKNPIKNSNTSKDTVPPKIKLRGNKNLILDYNQSYIEPGFITVDNKDGDLTNKVKIESNINPTKLGEYKVEYSVTDKAGNSAKAIRIVKVSDISAPKITLYGNKEINITLGNSFNDPGAIITDNMDRVLNLKTSHNIDLKNIGSYKVKYSSTDSSGNYAEAFRVVNVVNPKAIVDKLNPTNIQCSSWKKSKVYPNSSDYFYTLSNNDWGRKYLDLNSTGVQCIFNFKQNGVSKGGWYWGWPSNNDYQVKGYPEAIYGAKFKSILNPNSGFPALVSNIKSVYVDLAYKDLSITGKYNIALEFWLHTQKETSMDNIEYEVMFRFDPKGFHPKKTKLGEITLGGVVFNVYKDKDYDGSKKRVFINFVAKEKIKNKNIDTSIPPILYSSSNKDISSIKFNLKEALDYLSNIEFKDIPNTYMSGIEMGVEVINGSGALILDKFDVVLNKEKLLLSGTPENRANLYEEFNFKPTVNLDNVKFKAKNLPSGLKIDSNSGEISGILSSLGEYNITITATKGSLSAELNFNLKVSKSDKESLEKAIADNNFSAIDKLAPQTKFEDTINNYKSYFNSIPIDTIKVFNKHLELKSALAAISSEKDVDIYTLKNFNDFLQEAKKGTFNEALNGKEISSYYNIFFGYSVNAASSGIYNSEVFWDGWGDFIGPYGAHRIWSLEDEKLFKEAIKSIKKDGTFGSLPKDKIKYFVFYLSENYNLEATEREVLRKWDGWCFNTALRDTLKKGVDVKTEPLINLIKDNNLQLPVINAYLKITNQTPRTLNDLKDLIDNYMAQKGYTSYKEYFMHFKENIEEIKDDHLGKWYNIWSIRYYLRKVVGMNEQATLNTMSVLDRAKRVIRLYNTKEATSFWPILKDDIAQRPWHLFALDEGSETKGCEWVENRFFEDDEDIRVEMVNALGIGNTGESNKKKRLITYSTYNKPWNNDKIWYVNSLYHPEFGVPTIVRQGGICGQQGTLEQHSKSCLGVPTLGRAEPGHRDLVEVIKTVNGYKAQIRQGAAPKVYRGTVLIAPYRLSSDILIRPIGGERVAGIVNGLKDENSGFDTTLSRAMMYRNLALKDRNSTEILLKKAIDIYPENPEFWYELALFYASNNSEQKVIDLANNYLNRLEEINLENINYKPSSDFEKATAWGIVSALAVKKTPNAVNLSLEFIENNFPKGFILTGYQTLFKMLKEQNSSDFKSKSQAVFEQMLKSYSLEGHPEYGFWGNASWYWNNDEDFIAQMKDLVINSSETSETFRRNILKIIFNDDSAVLKEAKLSGSLCYYNKGCEYSGDKIVISDKESNKLYITTDSFKEHINIDEMGKTGSKLMQIDVKNENGDIYKLNIRVVKDYNNTFIAPNDSSEVNASTTFRFFATKEDNKELPKGIYTSVKNAKIYHKGHKENTYYDIGVSILKIQNLEVNSALKESNYTIEKMDIREEKDENDEKVKFYNYEIVVEKNSTTTFNFFSYPYFINNSSGEYGQSSVDLAVVDNQGEEYTLHTKIYQDLWHYKSYRYKADSAAPWKNYEYRFNISIYPSQNSELINKTISLKEPLIVFKRAYHLGGKTVEKITFDIKDLEIK